MFSCCPSVCECVRTGHVRPFNGPLSGTIRVSRYQKGKTNLDFTEARDSVWQWHQLGYMQVCTSLQTDNHTSSPPLLCFFTGRVPFLPPNQQRQSTEGTAITQAQTQQLESVQKRAIHIIWYSTRGLSYHNRLFTVNFPSLQARREELSNSFFREICNPISCLNYLLLPKRDTSVTSRLRAATPYARRTPRAKAKKYCSFINYGLSHYQ